MYKIKLHEFAYHELLEAKDWYALQTENLGEVFHESIKKQVHLIKQNPSWFLLEQDNIYKAYIPKFPYKLLYSFDEKQIIIWAIAHLHRKPNYWQTRIK